jgi:drug/metabolite transporter (DMT)-like permease
MKITLLCSVLVVAAMFENLGDAAGYLIKTSLWGQYALAIGAMSIYGALTVTVGRSGWSFSQAFPLGYLLAYFVVGIGLGSLLEGRRPSGYQAVAVLFMSLGLLINVAGQLQAKNAISQEVQLPQQRGVVVAASESE